MANLLGPMLGMIAMSAAGGAANQLATQEIQKKQQSSQLFNQVIQAAIQGGADPGVFDDPNLQKWGTSVFGTKDWVQAAKSVAQIARPAIQLQQQINQLKLQREQQGLQVGQQQIEAGQRTARQAAVAEQAQQYVPGVLKPRADVTGAMPQAGAEGAATGAVWEPTTRPPSPTEIRSSIANLNVDAPTQRAIMADPLVQAEFSDALQRETLAMNKAVQLSIAEANNQSRILAASIRAGTSSKDDILKNVSVPVREELLKMEEADKAAGGAGDIHAHPEWIGQAQEISTKKKIGQMDAYAQTLANTRYNLAVKTRTLGVAVSAASDFLKKYTSQSVAFNEFQGHAQHFRSLVRELSSFIRSSNIPGTERARILNLPIAQAARILQWGKLGELTQLIETYRGPLSTLEGRLAFQLRGQVAVRTRESIEASLPSINDTPGIMLGKLGRLEQAVSRISGALDDDRRRARSMIETVAPNSSLLRMFDRGEYQVLNNAMNAFGQGIQNLDTGAGATPRFLGVEEE